MSQKCFGMAENIQQLYRSTGLLDCLHNFYCQISCVIWKLLKNFPFETGNIVLISCYVQCMYSIQCLDDMVM